MKQIVNPLLVLAIVAACWLLVGAAHAQETAEAEKPAAAAEEAKEEATSKDAETAEAEADPEAAEPEAAKDAEPSKESEPKAEEGSGHDDDAEHASADHAEGSHAEGSDSGDEHGAGEHDEAHGDHGHHDLGHGDASATLEDPSALNKDLAIYTFVVFLGLLTLLGRFAWPTISEALEAREKRIEQNIADAEGQLEKAKGLVAEHEAQMAGAADQVRELLAEAHRDAEATVAKAKSDAKAEFEAERLRATRDIEQASDAAVRQLAEKTAGLAIDLAGRVVKQDISADRQSEIVREALGAFAKNEPSAN